MLIDAGINFEGLRTSGISHIVLAEYLFSSGMILNSEIKWITFHGAFDFAYLLKILVNSPLPETMDEFVSDIKMFFPLMYDTKIIASNCDDIRGTSLQKLGNEFNVFFG